MKNSLSNINKTSVNPQINSGIKGLLTNIGRDNITELSKKIPVERNGKLTMTISDVRNLSNFLDELTKLHNDFGKLASVNLPKKLLNGFDKTLLRYIDSIKGRMENVNKYIDTIEYFFGSKCLFDVKVGLITQDLHIRTLNPLEQTLITNSSLVSEKFKFGEGWTDTQWTDAFQQWGINDDMLGLLNINYYRVRTALDDNFKSGIINSLGDDVFKYFNITVGNLGKINDECLERNFRKLTDRLKKNYESRTLGEHNSYLFKNWKKKPDGHMSLPDLKELKKGIFIPFDFDSVKLDDEDTQKRLKERLKESNKIILDHLGYGNGIGYKYTDNDKEYIINNSGISSQGNFIIDYDNKADELSKMFSKLLDSEKFIIKNPELVYFFKRAAGSSISERDLLRNITTTTDGVSIDLVSILQVSQPGLYSAVEGISKSGLKGALELMDNGVSYNKPIFKTVLINNIIKNNAYGFYNSWKRQTFGLSSKIVEDFCVNTAGMKNNNDPILKDSIGVKNGFDILLGTHHKAISELYAIFSEFLKALPIRDTIATGINVSEKNIFSFEEFVTVIPQKHIFKIMTLGVNKFTIQKINGPAGTSFNGYIFNLEKHLNNGSKGNITDILAMLAQVCKYGESFEEILGIKEKSIEKPKDDISILDLKKDFFEIFSKYVKTIGRGTTPINRISLMILLEDSVFNNIKDTKSLLDNIERFGTEFIPFLSNFQNSTYLKSKFNSLDTNDIMELFKKMLKKEKLSDLSRESISLWERFRKNIGK